MIEVGELFPGVLSRPVTVREACPSVNWIGITSDRLLSNVSKNYHKGRKRKFYAKDTPYALTKDGAFGCRRSDVFVMDVSKNERKPHILELKRLQSYPDSYKNMGSYDRQWERVGNSVPPLLMRSIATQIRHKLWNGESLTRYPKTMTYPEILEAAWQDHLAPRDQNAPTVISTFAGGGGSSLGYSMAGYRELLAVEWDDNAVETFKLNFPDVPVYHGDIAKLSVEECMRLAGLTNEGELDLLDSSPPCQSFSSAGKRDMNDPRSQLFREFVRLLRGLKPKVFVMENVPGLVKGKMKLIFAEIMRELKASGYQVRCKKLNAMYFYVPQSRERLIFIGVRNDLGVEGSYPKVESRPVTMGEAIPKSIGTYHWGQYGNKNPQRELKKTNRPISTMRSTSGGSQHFTIDCGQGQRKLNNEELCVLGSFPNQFRLTGNYAKRWERVGNSVPPLLMRSIASHIRTQTLAKITTA